MTKIQARILLSVIGYGFVCWLMPIMRPADASYMVAVIGAHLGVLLLGLLAGVFNGLIELLAIAFPDEPEDK